ncbi:alpha/beta hydrolase [Rhodococcus qingshengii]|uniref:alpha/beta hydrolase n=1 Tax=Rhodococcus qingshengii TaxID=334542 RepID=UPI001C214CD6|nr:alpha/beta hydrolase [Rhodococcus qingshengii]QXC43291.1 alpha/beta hydrolase [Rhodococcus qingshengii]
MSLLPTVSRRTGTRYGRPSIESQVLYNACRWMLRPVVGIAPLTPGAMRRAAVLDSAAGVRIPSGIDREAIRFPGFDGELVRTAGSTADLRDGVVLYLHGGGFMCCGLNTHRPVVASIAKRTGLPVLHIAYRQLPSTSISGSVDDCLDAYRWLLEQGALPEKVVFVGDSAGGFLVFATALAAVSAGLDVPAGLVGLSPLLDLDCTTKSVHANARRDVIAPVSALMAIGKLGGQTNSPVDGDLAALPPSLLIVAESEVLRVDSEVMAQRLAAAGVPCSLQIWNGQVHAFPAVWPGLPESRAALRDVARFIRARLDAVPPQVAGESCSGS